MLKTEKKGGKKVGDPKMKITKNDLKNMIYEELNELNEAGASPDIARLQKLLDRAKIGEFISARVNTPQEFLQLQQLMIDAVQQLEPPVKQQVLRKALSGAGASQQTDAPPEEEAPPGNRYEERLSRRKKTRK